ncbi:hypothetical protein BaRGS_00012802 [Batillaria attramentaria]|uniref:Uncharacterized protein n=1 Tax=Batillaria attramentaria TaxID=370345 RepID=A0ABD0L9Z8_9CAEN
MKSSLADPHDELSRGVPYQQQKRYVQIHSASLTKADPLEPDKAPCCLPNTQLASQQLKSLCAHFPMTPLGVKCPLLALDSTLSVSPRQNKAYLADPRSETQ